MTIGERIEFLLQSNESHNHQISKLTEKMTTLTDQMNGRNNSMEKLIGVVGKLASISEAHERRIDNLEGN